MIPGLFLRHSLHSSIRSQLIRTTRQTTPTFRQYAVNSRPPLSSSPRGFFSRGRNLLLLGGFSLGTAGITLVASDKAYDVDSHTNGEPSLLSLVRAYVVYSLCSIPPLVDYSPAMLSFTGSIPGLKQISEFMIRYTFFDQVSACHSYRTPQKKLMIRDAFTTTSLLEERPPKMLCHYSTSCEHRTRAPSSRTQSKWTRREVREGAKASPLSTARTSKR